MMCANGDDFTVDFYTALEHVHTKSYGNHSTEHRHAVGLTSGTAMSDNNVWHQHNDRQMYFPLDILDGALSFKCSEGEFSFEADRDRIMAEIGGPGAQTALDDKVSRARFGLSCSEQCG